jgi:hypothetical protein
MKRSTGRRRQRFVPELTSIERRQLLSVSIMSIGQDGQDLVGPDASQGGDGIQDLHLQLSGLAGTVSQITIKAPGGFEWATEPDPTGAALAEFFPSSTAGDGDLYLSPQIKSDLPPAGGALALGGSTGNLIDLTNGMNLTVTVDYQTQTTPDTATVTVANLVSATDPMPAVTTPANANSSFTVVNDGQDGTGQSYDTGFVHLVVTAPAGVSLSSANFAQVSWGLSDQAGLGWNSASASLGHNHIYATLRPGTTNVVDLYFPPARDEAPPSGTNTPTMILTVGLPGMSTIYSTQFVGSAWNLNLLINSSNTQSPPSPPTTEAQLRADLMSASPVYDTIDLPTDTTIVITQPLEITHSVDIVGNGATLDFSQGNTAAWPAAAAGAIYVDAPSYTNIQLELTNFTIDFNQSAPIRWSNPAGEMPALYDPENNPSGVQHAVIDTRDANTNLNITILTLTGMTISGPPAFDESSYSALQTQLVQSGATTSQYVGEQDLNLITANDQDSGTITNSTFQGGTIELFGGPWNVTDNTVLGSTADTFSPAAFGLNSPHDVVINGNTVTQSNSNGREFRLVILAVSGWNNTIDNNDFGGGAGQIGNEMTYSGQSGGFSGINDPEVILAESSYGVVFVGRPGAVSADGSLLVLPDLRAAAYADSTGPGLVVSILEGVGPDGSAEMSDAGDWFRVAQQVSLANGTLELLMQNRLPAPPPGGYYVVEITGGFVNNSFSDNKINLTGKSSDGLVFNGEDYGNRIVGNDITGGTTYNNVYTGTAIVVTASLDSAASGSGPFPTPQGWTALPDLGTLIELNTIQDSVGGIVIGVQHSVNYWATQVLSTSETGRVLVTGSIVDNTFEFDASFLGSWATASTADGNNPAQSTVPPTVTIGSGFSAEAAGPYGSPRFPWTVGGALEVNGSDDPVFVDPIENVVTVQGNSTEMIAANGTATLASATSGQVYAGMVNGVTMASTISAETYNGLSYYPFNIDNLDTSDARTGTGGIQGLMVGQDNSDFVGSGPGSAAPDGLQDLHLVLTGLDPTATIESVQVIGTLAGEDWLLPATSTSPQFVVDRAAGATTADLYLAPTGAHLDDTFTIELTYTSGAEFSIPVYGVSYNPGLPLLPGGPPVTTTTSPVSPAPPTSPTSPAKPTAPTTTTTTTTTTPPATTVTAAPSGLSASLVAPNQVSLAWNASATAGWYVVERSLDDLNWSVLSGGVTATTFLDSNLAYSTTYYYRVLADSSAGLSAPGNSVFLQTEPKTDVLSAQSMVVDITRGSIFSGAVADFTDTDITAATGQFTATIRWGDGKVTTGQIVGDNGVFTVEGRHKYARAGSFTIKVTVTMSGTDSHTLTAASVADVVRPSRRAVKPMSHPAAKRKIAPAIRRHRAR